MEVQFDAWVFVLVGDGLLKVELIGFLSVTEITITALSAMLALVSPPDDAIAIEPVLEVVLNPLHPLGSVI